MNKELNLSGIGIHTGEKVNLNIIEDKINTGITFTAEIENEIFQCPAHCNQLGTTARSTALVLRGQTNRHEVRTIEHFMSAAYLFGLPNLEVILKKELAPNSKQNLCFEMPILDGSAKEWINHLENFGCKLKTPEEYLVCNKEFTVKNDQGAFVSFKPCKEKKLEINYKIEFPPHWQQSKKFYIAWEKPLESLDRYKKEIAPARTFALKEWIEQLRKNNLGLGGSLENALILDGNKVLNESGFLVENELAAHKILDAIGDFSLIGKALCAEVDINKASHAIHIQAIRHGIKNNYFSLIK